MKKKILIIDDDVIYSKILQKILCGEYTILFAETSDEAINIIQNGEIPDFIIADLNLPDIHNEDWLITLKEKLGILNKPIMVISGMDDDNIKQQLSEIGISEFLIKPIEKQILKDKIASLID